MKMCSICKEIKSYFCFYVRVEACRLRRDCIKCFNLRLKSNYDATREIQLEKRKENYKQNKERYNKKAAAWRLEHPAKMTEYKREWKKRNRGKVNADWMKRHAAKLNATPKWLTKEQIKEIEHIYKTCPVGYHVDHIIPLQGQNVKGLHVPWNLQHLPAIDNVKKGNR